MKFLVTIPVYILLFLIHVTQVFAEAAGTLGQGESAGGIGGAESAGTLPPTKFVGSTVLKDPLDSSISSIPDFFKAIIEILLIFAIPFVVFFIILAGFNYVTAQRNPEKIKKAHNALLYALVGGLLILGANVLLTVITNTVTQVTAP